MAAHRLEQSRVGADAAAEHDQREIERRRQREDVERDPPGRLLDDRGPDRVPGFGRREELPHLERRLEHRLLSAASSAASWDSDAAHGSTSSARPLRTASSSPAFPLWPRCSFRSSITAAPESRSDEQEGEVRDVPGDSAPLLGDRREVDVVLERHRRAERVLELLPQVGRLQAPAGREPRRARRRGRRPPEAPPRRSPAGRRAAFAGTQQRADGAGQRGDPLLDRAAAADLLPRANLAGEIAERRAHRARAEVDAEDEGRFRIGLVVDGAVVRAVRVVRRLADEPVLEQRAKHERHRRPRDPGPASDLGARDRPVTCEPRRARCARSAPAAAPERPWSPSSRK